MRVVATAGHVDHGKSALVRALTGMEPDRWQAERDRGMTIDLGFVWTGLPDGETVAFVDVPGHQRFIGNMVAGLGPCPAVMFVVAADEGWSRQSQEHLAAIDALGVEHGLLVVTKSDLADPRPVLADALQRLSRSSLGKVAAVSVSARTGAGIPELTGVLQRWLAGLPPSDPDSRIRLWVDRSFTIRGAGTVVTGTLAEGSVAIGDELTLGDRKVRIRGVQSLDVRRDRVRAVARVALNLADTSVDEAGRGSVLLSPGRWWVTPVLDARLRLFDDKLPQEAMLHIGTAAVQVRLRPLPGAEQPDLVRITLPTALPLTAGDRAILRNPGAQRIIGGVQVLDVDPPPLRRRGAARRRAEELADATGTVDLAREIRTRGVLSRVMASMLGVPDAVLDTGPPPGVRVIEDQFVAESHWRRWMDQLGMLVDRQASRDPLQPTVSHEAIRSALQIPGRALLPALIKDAGLSDSGGRVGRPGLIADLGPAERGLVEIEARLTENPWAAPDRDELSAAGLGARELAAAARSGRILRLPGEVVLRPDAAPRAIRVLAALPQPFTLSQARRALGSTRRVVVPLLEHLDSRGWTRRVDAEHRQVVR